MTNDPYLEQMLKDLGTAEFSLKHAINNRNNPFADNGEQRYEDCKANVDRLHELIRSYSDTRINSNQETK